MSFHSQRSAVLTAVSLQPFFGLQARFLDAGLAEEIITSMLCRLDVTADPMKFLGNRYKTMFPGVVWAGQIEQGMPLAVGDEWSFGLAMPIEWAELNAPLTMTRVVDVISAELNGSAKHIFSLTKIYCEEHTLYRNEFVLYGHSTLWEGRLLLADDLNQVDAHKAQAAIWDWMKASEVVCLP